jgi:hypothetical protein
MLRKFTWTMVAAVSLVGQNTAGIKWSARNYSATLTSNRAEVVGRCGDKSFKALIEIMHASGTDETFTLNIRIPGASKFELLNLSEFAGPGSPAGEKKVLTIKSASMKEGYRFFGEGGFTTEYGPDEFTIDLATPRDKRKPLFQVLNKALDNSEEWIIRIVSPKNPKQFVEIPFSFVGTQNYLKSHLR